MRYLSTERVFQADGTVKILTWRREGWRTRERKEKWTQKGRVTVQQVGHHRTIFYKALAFNMSKMGTTVNGEALTIFGQRSDKNFPRGE